VKIGSHNGQEYKKGIETTREFFAKRDLKEQLSEELGSNPNNSNSKNKKM
jgi:hypothetical protein